jgi:hypothetical protein
MMMIMMMIRMMMIMMMIMIMIMMMIIIIIRMVIQKTQFGPTRDGITGEWRKPHNEELNDLYCSPYIVWVIKWRRMRWAGHVASMGGEERRIQGFVREA